MFNPKITSVLTPRMVPDTIRDLFRPGEVVTARVETLAGKLLTLWVGNERLEALLSDGIPPQLLRPGQKIRLKVVELGPPVVLSLSYEAPKEKDPLQWLPRFLQVLAREIPQKGPLAPGLPGETTESRPRDFFLKGFFLFLESVSNRPEREGPSLDKSKETRDLLLKWWQENSLVVPFLFGDRVSWGYLCEEKGPSEARDFSLFILRLFLPRLGFMEAHFGWARDFLEVGLYFVRAETLRLARKELSFLQTALGSLRPKVVVKCEELSVSPGILLAQEV